MPAPNAIKRAAMIPGRTTFHRAVGASTHVRQRRMVAVLATRQLSLGEGSVGAALPGGEVGSAQRVDDGIGRNATGCGPFATAYLPVELLRGVSIAVDSEAAPCLHRQSEQPLGRVVALETGVDLHSDAGAPTSLEYGL